VRGLEIWLPHSFYYLIA